jgi:ABC-type branched-subunit amino acid transport system substrate-binding protein
MHIFNRRWLLLLGALVATVALVAVACGDDDEDVDETPVASPAATEPAAEEVPGVTDTEILLGTSFPLSQSPAAAYSPITNGMTAYFDYINDTEGGVNGRQIRLIVCDDHYNPPDAAECARKLVEQDKVFASIGGLGTAAHSAAWKYLEDLGVPDMWILSGATKWTDPIVKTRFGGNPDYETEGTILGQYIAENHDGKKLGLLIENTSFGEEGEEAIRKGIEGSDVEVVARELYEVVDWDVTAQTQRLKNAGAEVVAAYAVAPPAASLVKTAREVLDWDVPFIVTGVLADDIFISLCGPENAEGIVSVVFGHQVYETDYPGIQQYMEVMERYDIPVENYSLYGYIVGELTVEGLKRAGENLTPDTLIDALEAIKGFQCSVCMAPVSFSETDHRPFEIEVYISVQDGKWVPFGEPVNFESTP